MRNAIIIVLLTVAIGSPAWAQNLLVNPGFDVADQLTGWTCPTIPGSPSWIPNDRLGSVDSGAMERFGSADSANAYFKCDQCVPVEELLTYGASVWHYWPDDPDVTQEGDTRISVIFYSNPDCTSSTGIATVKAGYHPALDTWYKLITDEVTAPQGATSALFVFGAWQSFADHWIRTRLDDVELIVTTIFRDDFESGDDSAWSAISP